MTILLLIVGIIFTLIGFLGSIWPVLPGLPMSWLGLLMIYFIPGVSMDYWFLGSTLFLTIVMFVLGYTIPANKTKKYGGSKSGANGSIVGIFIGSFFFPIGLFLGAFLGAFIGELIFNGSNTKTSFKAAWGSFLGFFIGMFANILISLIFLGLFIYKVIQYSDIIF